MKKTVKRRGHRHAWDIVDKVPVQWTGRITKRSIKVRVCACGEPGFEVPR
jgi:hypothetical protein